MYTQLKEANIEELLSNNFIGRMACCNGNKPYIVPITYYYDKPNNSIIGYSAEGTKINMLRRNPNVCFEVDEVTSIANWKSVIAHGTFQELAGADKRNAEHLFVSKLRELINNPDHHLFIKDLSAATSENDVIVVYRINLNNKTGRSQEE